MNKLKSNIKALILLVLALLISSTVIADYTHPGVDRLIQANKEPAGVVFELIERDKKTWEWAAPMIKDLKAQLKEKYPNLDIAIVSHGREQFQLMSRRVKEQPEAISLLRDIVKDGTNLHVCGVYSGWRDVKPEEYIDIVDVAASGPAKINDYINLGYQPIQLYKKQAE